MVLPQEIEKLIDFAVEDGVLEETEIKVLRDKAIQFGVNPEEVLMIAKAKCEQIWKAENILSSEIKGRICPYCESEITKQNVLSGVCPNCGNILTINDAGSKALLNYMDDLEKSLVQLKEKGAYKFNHKVRAELESKIRLGRSFYGDNKKINFLISEVEASICEFERKRRNLIISAISVVCVVLLALGFGINSCLNNIHERDLLLQKTEKELLDKASIQADSLCALIDRLPQPTSNNYKQCERQLISITWKNIPCPNEEINEKVNGTHGVYKEYYVSKKRAYAQCIGAVPVMYEKDGRKEIEEYKYHGAPQQISYPSISIYD